MQLLYGPASALSPARLRSLEMCGSRFMPNGETLTRQNGDIHVVKQQSTIEQNPQPRMHTTLH